MKVANKVIVVTGAGSGMGRALVLNLVKKDARVAAVDLNENTLQETVKLAGQYQDKISTHVVNVSDRKAVEALPDAIVVINTQGTIVLVNAQTERFFGYKRTEMEGWPIEKLVPQRFQAGHVAKRDHYFTKPETRPMGVNLRLAGQRKDGTEFPVDISLSPLRTARGIFATAVIRDISQRKRDEAKFRTLVENIPAVTLRRSMTACRNVMSARRSRSCLAY